MNNNRELFKNSTKCVFVNNLIKKLNKKVNEIKMSINTLIFIKSFVLRISLARKEETKKTKITS